MGKRIPASTVSPKVIIGAQPLVDRTILLTFGFTMLAIGLQLACLASCLTMLSKKSGEPYLSLMAASAGACVVRTLFTSSLPILPLTEVVYLSIRQIMFTSVNICLTLILVTLLGIPQDFRWMQEKRNMALLGCVIVCLLSYFCPINDLIKLIIFVLTAWCFSQKTELPSKQKLLLGICYAAENALSLLMTLVSDGFIAAPGFVTILLRILHFSSLLSLMSCIYIVNARFASRFNDTQLLAKEIEEINATLEMRIAERTSQLREEQRKKHEFMTNIFHDLRSPIFVLKQRIEVLRNSCSDELSLKIVASRLSYLERLIEDLFTVAKLESEEDIFDMDDTDLSAVLI